MNFLYLRKIIRIKMQQAQGKRVVKNYQHNNFNTFKPIIVILIIHKAIINSVIMKKFISKFDLFPALPTLRARGEPEVVNLCGSLFSIAIMGVFVYFLIINIIQTATLQKITATEVAGSGFQEIKGVKMGIGLQGYSFINLRNIFQLRAFTQNQKFQYKQLDVFPCTRQIWSSFTDEKYKMLRLETFMCFQHDGVAIYGENGQANITALHFNISLCDNSTSPVTCASNQQIDFFFDYYMLWGRFMACSLVILDTGFNLTSEIPITYKSYEKTLWILFNRQQQIIMQIYLGTYEINTDISFLPYQEIKKQSGYFVSECVSTMLININWMTVLAEFYVFSSPNRKVVNRVYGKLDSVLSYLGGLYGILIGFFTFFMLSYNQYKYQLRVSQGAFNFVNSSLTRQEQFHFLMSSSQKTNEQEFSSDYVRIFDKI